MSRLIRDTFLTGLMIGSVLLSMYTQYFSTTSMHDNAYAVWALSGICFFLYLRFATQGNVFVEYVKAAKIEISKVIWPQKDDVVRTTIAVGVAVVLFSIVISFLDSLMVSFVGLITG